MCPSGCCHVVDRKRSSLDHIELKNVFSRRAHVFEDHSIHFELKGAFRSALRTALDEVIGGYELGSVSHMTRGWKLFMLLPRLLLHWPSRGGMVAKKKVRGKDHLVPKKACG